jgi:hypothetical protein
MFGQSLANKNKITTVFTNDSVLFGHLNTAAVKKRQQHTTLHCRGASCRPCPAVLGHSNSPSHKKSCHESRAGQILLNLTRFIKNTYNIYIFKKIYYESIFNDLPNDTNYIS